MADERETKLCKTCFEQIDIRARMCPHCGRWQWKNALRSWAPYFAVILVLGGACVLPLTRIARFQEGIAGAAAVRYTGQIEVTQSEMFFGQSKDGPTVFVVGKVKNNSDVTWESIHMEVQFMDPEGKLIDVEVQAHCLSKILPHGEMAFKLRAVAEMPRERYDSYQVSVRAAQDARATPW